jgi:hypothetical protein
MSFSGWPFSGAGVGLVAIPNDEAEHYATAACVRTDRLALVIRLNEWQGRDTTHADGSRYRAFDRQARRKSGRQVNP